MSGGGGGAGGIVNVINDNYAGSLFGTDGQISIRNPGGGGGAGYGCGGGGAGSSIFNKTYVGGDGTQGFVYIVEEDKFVTTDLTGYNPKYTGTYTFILLGGGGCGGNGYPVSGNGGDAGQLIIKKVRGVSITSKINITIGQGGKIVNSIPEKAGDTILSCVLSASTVEIIAIGASPAKSGDKANIQLYTIQSPGGMPSKAGGVFNQSIIDNMNSSSPTEIY